MYEYIPDNPYLLLTPGPLSTSKGVRNALLQDWCTWDDDYNIEIVQSIRKILLELACKEEFRHEYTSVLMQGSGSFGVEACLTTAVPDNGQVLILSNGSYGERMCKMASTAGIHYQHLSFSETVPLQLSVLKQELEQNPNITHVAMVHCETTTGILNPVKELALLAKEFGKITIVDAMSSFGGIPIDMNDWGIDFLISSANKCIQGVPGFAFVLGKKSLLNQCEGNARSHSLDLYDQYQTMEPTGKWRFTSPTHVVRAFYQALLELLAEGGIEQRYARYMNNQKILAEGMQKLGFSALLPAKIQSPIITSFYVPNSDFSFTDFYVKMKQKGFVLYPGKISQADTFRIGNIGEVYPEDVKKLLTAIQEVL